MNARRPDLPETFTKDIDRRSGTVPLRVLLRPLWPAIHRYRRSLMAAILCGWSKFGLPLLIPWLTKQVIDEVLEHDETGPALVQLGYYAAIAAGVIVAIGISTYFRHTIAASLRARIEHLLRKQLFHHIQRLSMTFFSRHHSGSLGSRVSKDITHAGLVVDRGIILMAMDGVTFCIIAAILLTMQWQLALVIFAVLILIGLSLRHFRPPIRQHQRWIQDGQSSITGHAAEYFAGISVVKAFAGEGRSGRAFAATSRAVCDLQEQNSRLHGGYMSISYALLLLMQCSVVFFGAYLILTNPTSLSRGELVAFLLYVGFINGSLQRLLDGLMMLEDGFAALERIHEILRVQPSPPESEQPLTPPISGCVTCQDITFAYGDTPVLKDFTFTFEQGRSYALVGPSGGGKSTLCQLLLRFYDPQQGGLMVDDHNLRTIAQSWYRQHIAVVLQDPIIFSSSVYENIAFAKDDATETEVVDAAIRAQAHDFIQELPLGYHTLLGERGVSLSGGQRQRIAIARALMRDPRLLILDEATSALDTMTERSIQDVIENLQGTRTVIVIAHRLSTIRNVDCILVMADGRLVEHGGYDDLLARGGLFSALAEEQEYGA